MFIISKRPIDELSKIILTYIIEKDLRHIIKKGLIDMRVKSDVMFYLDGVHAQIILRPYASVSQLLNSFDLPASGVAFDGQRVWVAPASHWCLRHMVCPLNSLYRSPSFERRAEKYFASKGFALAVPTAPVGAGALLLCGPGARREGEPVLAIRVRERLGENLYRASVGLLDPVPWSYFQPGPNPSADRLTTSLNYLKYIGYPPLKDVIAALESKMEVPPIPVPLYNRNGLDLNVHVKIDVYKVLGHHMTVNLNRLNRCLFNEDVPRYFEDVLYGTDKVASEYQARLTGDIVVPLRSYWVLPASAAEATSSFVPLPVAPEEWVRDGPRLRARDGPQAPRIPLEELQELRALLYKKNTVTLERVLDKALRRVEKSIASDCRLV